MTLQGSGLAVRLRWAALAFSAGVLLAAGFARSAEDVGVDAKHQGDGLAISAHATIHAPLSLIWQTLTDYNDLAEFIPGIETSHVIERRGNTAIVEQSGEARVLMFHYPIAVIVESDEHYPSTIVVKLLTGNLRQLRGAYRIAAVPGARDEFVLRWRGIIEPDIFLPSFLTLPGLRESVEVQFLGMVREIERRQRLRHE